MNKVTAAILLFSGTLNPEQELSTDEEKELRVLVDSLSKPSDEPRINKLGFSGFAIHWNDKYVKVKNNVVEVFEKNVYPHKIYQDNGIENKLRLIFLNSVFKNQVPNV